MDEDLKKILDNLVASADDTGCSNDDEDEDAIRLTVVNKDYVDELRQYVKHYELGS